MQEIIQKVVASETEAKQLVQAAWNEAGELLTRARLEARQRVAAAHTEARLEAEKILAAAEKEAANAKQERLAQAAREIDTSIRLDAVTAQQAVEAALHCLCGRDSKTI